MQTEYRDSSFSTAYTLCPYGHQAIPRIPLCLVNEREREYPPVRILQTFQYQRCKNGEYLLAASVPMHPVTGTRKITQNSCEKKEEMVSSLLPAHLLQELQIQLPSLLQEPLQ